MIYSGVKVTVEMSPYVLINIKPSKHEKFRSCNKAD